MCCLRYEHEFYVQSRKRFPKEGKVLQTAAGEEKVVANDIFRDRVTLRLASGESRIIPLAQLRYELGEAPMPVEEELPGDSDSDAEELEEARRQPLVPLARAERAPRAEPPREPRTVGRSDASRGPRRDERRDERRPERPTASRRPERGPSAPAPAPTPEATGDGGGPATPSDDATRKRRRRGRRGGRRGRGDGTGPAGAADQTD